MPVHAVSIFKKTFAAVIHQRVWFDWNLSLSIEKLAYSYFNMTVVVSGPVVKDILAVVIVSPPALIRVSERIVNNNGMIWYRLRVTGFSSAKEALDAGIKAIKEEGIQSFIGDSKA